MTLCCHTENGFWDFQCSVSCPRITIKVIQQINKSVNTIESVCFQVYILRHACCPNYYLTKLPSASRQSFVQQMPNVDVHYAALQNKSLIKLFFKTLSYLIIRICGPQRFVFRYFVPFTLSFSFQCLLFQKPDGLRL